MSVKNAEWVSVKRRSKFKRSLSKEKSIMIAIIDQYEQVDFNIRGYKNNAILGDTTRKSPQEANSDD